MAELNFVAVQESREQGDSHHSGFLCDRFCAGVDAVGCFGTQTWIRRPSVLDNFKAVSTQSAVAITLPLEFRTLKVKSTFWNQCTQLEPLLRLLVMRSPSSVTSMPDGLCWFPSSGSSQ